MRFLRLMTAFATVALAAGCGEERDPRAVSKLTPELSPVVEGNNDFAWKLYGAASHQQGNLFFSPFSVSAAFGMTYAGAANDTATEMHDVLGIKSPDDTTFHANFGSLIRDLGGEHQGRAYQLYVANRLFGQKGSTFVPSFLELVKGDYAAPLDTVDYNAPDAAAKHINDWVSQETQARIPTLLDPGVVDSSTRLVLANAIYFKADWATQFDPDATQAVPFTRADGSSVSADMMSAKEEVKTHLAYDLENDVRLIDVDYEDHELSMLVLLPAKADGLPALEAKLSREYVDGLLAQEQESEVSLRMPRWEFGAELPLADILGEMGMKRAFDPEQADFSKMVDPSSGGPVYIGFAVHKAFVKVDEQGTEAAAATATGIELSSAPEEVVLDHAFVYLIRDRLTGSILFMGRMDDPTAKGTL